MEEEPSNLSKLFCPVENKPMQFAIIVQNLLVFEMERVLVHIADKGGEFMGFDPEDSGYIVLASRKYKPPPNQTVFDIKYVKRCVKEKKLLDLRDFLLSGENISGPRCCPFQLIVEANRCRHFLTAEQVLNKIQSYTGPKRTSSILKDFISKKPQGKKNVKNNPGKTITEQIKATEISQKLDLARAHLEIKQLLARQAEN